MIHLLIVFLNQSDPIREKIPSDPTKKHYNPHFYNPEIDIEEFNEVIGNYGRDKPDELDFTDVWDISFINLLNPEYFYHSWFCGFLYTFETEVNILHCIPLNKLNIIVYNQLPL